MNHRTHPNGATLTETLAVLVCLLVAMALILPALAQVGQTMPVTRSTHNLRVLHEALACYAADWNDRQFTAVPDDVGIAEGDCGDYVEQHCGCWPPLWAGSDCEGAQWGFFFECAADDFPPSINCPEFAAFPISFDPSPTLGAGVFRNPQVKSLHDYVNGKYYDPAYFAPLDGKAFRAALPLFAEPCEFVPPGVTVPSSYMLSPAAMYDPDVMRAPSQGGFQDPRTLDHGFRSPAVTQVRYPDLKTWMIEHNWLRNPPAACNPDYVDLYGSFSEECDPYLFNHGADAEPLAFFFDGSVQALRTGDVADDDAQVLDQTGGVDGLWSRDTPLGETGYFGDLSVDGIVVSHHVLTTDGILGRDRLHNGGSP